MSAEGERGGEGVRAPLAVPRPAGACAGGADRDAADPAQERRLPPSPLCTHASSCRRTHAAWVPPHDCLSCLGGACGLSLRHPLINACTNPRVKSPAPVLRGAEHLVDAEPNDVGRAGQEDTDAVPGRRHVTVFRHANHGRTGTARTRQRARTERRSRRNS